MKKQLKEYFYFSKSEKRGIVFLSVIIVILLFFKHFLSNFISTPAVDNAYINKILTENIKDSLVEKKQEDQEEEVKIFSEMGTPTYKNKKEIKYFYFNPNTVTATELKQLGCSDKLIKTWLNFKLKGGYFKTKTDVKKIYGVSAYFYAKIEPYILLENTAVTENKVVEPENKANTFSEKKEQKLIIEINIADTVQLKYLPGIGSKISNRIISYRSKLGGFISTEQLKEVFGIDSILYNKIVPYITIDENRIYKIPINTVQVSQLKQHPYLTFNIANAIVQYRDRHGNFLTIQDLKKVVLVNETVFKKISPYLKI